MEGSRQTDRRIIRVFTIPLVILAVCILMPHIYSSLMINWPPVWMERRTQRHLMLERIQLAGGWGALKRDCDALADNYKDAESDFHWIAPGHRWRSHLQLPR